MTPHKPVILMVDDTPENLELLGNVLLDRYDLRVATCGEDGLELAASLAPDLILLDVMMPGIDGFEVCRRLKADPSTRDIPVMFVTAVDESRAEAEGLRLGAVDYLSKPINVPIAEQRIANLLAAKAGRDQLALAANVFRFAHEGIMITDAEARIIDVNDAFVDITGYDRASAVGQKANLLKSGHHKSEFYAAMWAELQSAGYWSGEVWNRHRDGHIYVELLTISAVCDWRGRVTQYVAIFADISMQKAYQEQLEHQAHYDALTHLPNRTLFSDRLKHAMSHAASRERTLALLFIDLDGFKEVNDRFGHEAGDHLLTELAQRMRDVLRAGDTLARLGGDEFVALLVDLPDAEVPRLLVDRLLGICSAPVTHGGHVMRVSASVGVTMFPQQQQIAADQLMRQADQAMYQAKIAGKNRYYVHDVGIDMAQRQRIALLTEAHSGIAQDAFRLYYQPKVNLRTGEVTGVEALLRWQHPERGLLAPGQFLADLVADRLMDIKVGEWVIGTALDQILRWRSQGIVMPVSVNLSGSHLLSDDFVERLKALLSDRPTLPPNCLELEVLETSALDDLEGATTVIKACNTLGVGFALDDFGTGYSSLSYLRRLPVDTLKIDQSFVRDMLVDPDDLAILEGVLGLTRAFRRAAVAEGVESFEHGQQLLRLQCEQAQGYAIARPMPPEQMTAWLTQWREKAPWQAIRHAASDEVGALYAIVEHRAWVAALEEHLTDRRPYLPELNRAHARFQQWLEAPDTVRVIPRDVLDRCRDLHQAVHDEAEQLIRIADEQDPVAAMARLPALHAVRDALINAITSWLDDPARH